MGGGHRIHWIPLVLAGVLALLAVWLNQLTHRPVMEDHGGFAHEPDTIVTRFNALAFDAEGRPLHRLTADKLIHYMDDDTTEIMNPRFRVLEGGRLQSDVVASRGQISTNGQHVHLLGNVRVRRYSETGGLPVTLDTDYLWITPDAHLMRTDRAVTLRQGKTVITAGSMLANTKNKELTLSKGVHGYYEKNN
ncbi:MAG: LPS export ABC transporter periplasmic protein LptC [Pseudomonadota bacterium]